MYLFVLIVVVFIMMIAALFFMVQVLFYDVIHDSLLFPNMHLPTTRWLCFMYVMFYWWLFAFLSLLPSVCVSFVFGLFVSVRTPSAVPLTDVLILCFALLWLFCSFCLYDLHLLP